MKKILIKLIRPVKMPYRVQDLILLFPRIICGYLLTSNFGAAKFGMPWSPPDNNLGLFEVAFWFPNDIAAYGGIFSKFPAFFAWTGAFAEAVGGLFLIFGLGTRIWSFLVICTMLVAMFMQQFHQGLWNMMPAMGFLWIGIFYMITGSGRYGIDNLIYKVK